MAANTNPIFPLSPLIESCSLVAASAGTSREPVAHASLGSTPVFAVQLTTTSTNGKRVDKIQVKACATAIGGATTAGSVIIWKSNGTTAYPIAEILTPVVTPSASVASLDVSQTFTTLILGPGDTLWASTTIAGAAAAHALAVHAYEGVY